MKEEDFYKEFVLDASATLAWCFKDESSQELKTLLRSMRLGSMGHVPPVWWPEVSNALLISQKRGRISQPDMYFFLHFLDGLRINTYQIKPSQFTRESLMLASEQKLTVYDASYLALAKIKNIPLVTKDKALIEAAKNVNIELF